MGVASSHGLSSDDHDDAGVDAHPTAGGQGNAAHAGARRPTRWRYDVGSPVPQSGHAGTVSSRPRDVSCGKSCMYTETASSSRRSSAHPPPDIVGSGPKWIIRRAAICGYRSVRRLSVTWRSSPTPSENRSAIGVLAHRLAKVDGLLHGCSSLLDRQNGSNFKTKPRSPWRCYLREFVRVVCLGNCASAIPIREAGPI